MLLVFLLSMGAFLLMVWKTSRFLGADFQTTLKAIVALVVVATLVSAVARFCVAGLLTSCAAFAAIAWPFTWSLLDSIANAGVDGFFLPVVTDAWYVQAWFRWGVEASLAAFWAYLVVREW